MPLVAEVEVRAEPVQLSDVSQPYSIPRCEADPSPDDKNPSPVSTLASGSTSPESSYSPQAPVPSCSYGIAPRPLRYAHASRQLTATLGACPRARYRCLAAWLLSGAGWDLRLTFVCLQVLVQ